MKLRHSFATLLFLLAPFFTLSGAVTLYPSPDLQTRPLKELPDTDVRLAQARSTGAMSTNGARWFRLELDDWYRGYVSREWVVDERRLRAGAEVLARPSEDARVIANLAPGDQVEVIWTGEWWEISFKRNMPVFFEADNAKITQIQQAIAAAQNARNQPAVQVASAPSIAPTTTGLQAAAAGAPSAFLPRQTEPATNQDSRSTTAQEDPFNDTSSVARETSSGITNESIAPVPIEPVPTQPTTKAQPEFNAEAPVKPPQPSPEPRMVENAPVGSEPLATDPAPISAAESYDLAGPVTQRETLNPDPFGAGAAPEFSSEANPEFTPEPMAPITPQPAMPRLREPRSVSGPFTGELRRTKTRLWVQPPYPFELVDSNGRRLAYLDLGQVRLQNSLDRYLERRVKIFGTRVIEADQDERVVIQARSVTSF